MNSSWWSKIYTPLIIALVFVVGMSIGRHFLSGGSFVMNNSNNKLSEILQYIENDYVDTVDVSAMEEQAIIDMIDHLDPHSSYIEAENYHYVVDPLLGNFDGIGIQFRMIRDSLTVMMPIVGGPSYKAGILAGDKIVMADNDTIANKNMSSADIVKHLKGERGSVVSLKICRPYMDSLLSFDVIRDVIPLYSLDARFMVDEQIGYIKISKFSATTIEEFHEAIDSLLSVGMKKVILDLRGNSGGYLSAAISMADTFLDDEQLIVYTKGKNRPEKKYFANKHSRFKDGKLVILIDENSASASEIVAGAIQDNDRGLIIGRRSFGKGLVQEQMNFSDGSALRLTVARYYTPTGRCIQRSYADGTDAYYADHYQQMIDDLTAKTDSAFILDSLKFITPEGKIVYGGGGIFPDIALALDTSINYYFYNQLIRKSIIVEYTIDYYNQHQQELQQYSNLKDFSQNFSAGENIYQDLITKAQLFGVEASAQNKKNSKDLVLNNFYSELGRLLYGDEAYFYLYLQDDRTFLKALDVIKEEL